MTDRGPRLVVAGATGRVGRRLIDLMASDRCRLSALTRDPDRAGLPEHVEAIAAEFGRPGVLRDALAGASAVFVAHGTSADQVRNEIALIDAAVAAGVGHIVKLSALGPPTRLAPYAWHTEIEAHLARQPIASTVLRPSSFVDALKRAGPAVAADRWSGSAGQGRVNFIDTRDVADVARLALLQDVGAGSTRAYHLTGPRAWTMREIADELSTLLGREVAYRVASFDAHRSALMDAGLPALVADLLVGLDRLAEDRALGETTLTFQELTGRQPRTLPDWLAENIEHFRG